jgi:type IV pilus assembly protein PilM
LRTFLQHDTVDVLYLRIWPAFAGPATRIDTMAKTFGVWGIDIGQCALKALRLEIIDGQPTATAFDYIEHPKILSQPDADPDALTREALEKFLSRNPLGRDHVSIGVPGQSGLARFVKLPPVEEKKVTDIVKFEAKQQIPFPLEEVVWDYQRLSDKVEVIGGFAMETEIGLFAMKRDIINRFLGHYNGVKAEVNVVQMAPLALTNYAAYELLKKRGGDPALEEQPTDLPPGKKKKCVVILDIGTDASNLIITDGAKIIWQRPVPLGGNNFTRVLTKETKLTFAKAEHLKRNAAKSPELAMILKALRPVLTDFVGEVQRSLGYFTNTHRDAHVAYMVGLGSAFKLPGLQKYLSEKLALDVRKPSAIDGIVGDAVLNDPVFQENSLTFPVAYGLALQGLALAQTTPEEQRKYSLLRTNLLPSEIRTDRLIRAKKPWAAAAAACVLLGVSAAALGYGSQYKALTDKKLTESLKKGSETVSAAGTQNGAYTKTKGDVESAVSSVKAIVAGNDERLNWIRLHEVVANTLPKPPLVEEFDEKGDVLKVEKLVVDKVTGHPVETGNLTLGAKAPPYDRDWPDQRDYLLNENALKSIQKYSTRVRAGVTSEKLLDNQSLFVENLPLVNIEAIDCRFTDNLQQFLDNANDEAKKEHGLFIVADLQDERVYKIKKADGTEEEFKMPAERESSTEPKAKPPGADARVMYNPKASGSSGWVVEVRGYTYHKDGFLFVKRTLVRNLQEINEYARAKNQHEKIGKVLKDAKDPVFGKVSHAFLGAQRITEEGATKKADSKPPFALVNNGTLDKLVAASAPTGADPGSGGDPRGGGNPGAGMPGIPGMPGMPGGDGAATGAWKPLLGTSSQTSSGTGAGGMFGMGAGPGIPGLFNGAGQDAGQPVGGPNKRQLVEFIVYFVWQEPVSATGTIVAPAAP